jgi:hypothetical protein
VGGSFMLAAGLAVVLVMITLPPWVYVPIGVNLGIINVLQKRVTVDEAVAAPIATICPWMTGAEAEPARTVQNERPSSHPVLDDQWRAFLAQRQEGDELWTFCTPQVTWQHMFGLGGIALVSHGKVVGKFVRLLQ